MSRYFSLHVPSSCKQEWNQMVPNSGGRFCSSCEKQVIDFTRMTDTELVSYFKTYKGGGCGKFTGEQIGRKILIPPSRMPWVKYLFRIALPAVLLLFKSSAQAQKTTAPTEITPIKPVAAPSEHKNQMAPITGQVVDDQNLPIAGALVIIKGTMKGAITDTSGRFVISDYPPNATLTVSSVGFESNEINVSAINRDKPIRLALAPGLTGEVLVVGSVVKHTSSDFVPVTKKLYHAKQTQSIVAYPNPVAPGTNINLRCNKIPHGKYLAEIVSTTGEVIQTSLCNYDKFDKQVSLSVGRFTPGSYVLRLTHLNSGKFYSQEIIVRE